MKKLLFLATLLLAAFLAACGPPPQAGGEAGGSAATPAGPANTPTPVVLATPTPRPAPPTPTPRPTPTVAVIESATEEVLLAERTAASWQDRVSDLRRTRDVANGSIFDVNEAEGELLAAESRLIEKITALRLARLELRRVQGILAAECGLDVLVP